MGKRNKGCDWDIWVKGWNADELASKGNLMWISPDIQLKCVKSKKRGFPEYYSLVSVSLTFASKQN